MTSAALAAAMAAMLARAPTHAERATIRMVAAQILLRAPRSGIDPLVVAALIAHESGFRIDARGALGELGLGQLKRHTEATRGYDDAPDAVLLAIPVNVMLTVRHLAHVRAKCQNAPPIAWLSVYSGRARCRPSKYSRAILADYAVGRAAVDALEVAGR